jgi:predicted Zn-dependent peptidase
MFRRALPGGAVLVGERVPDRRSAALGIWVRVGSRDEDPGREGLAHFIEHLVFKGTARRDARQIAESLERVGGSLDAFTTKDTTCFHARILERDIDLAADVLSDLVVNPQFAARDVKRERRVVLEELRNLEDNPEDLVGDLAMAHLWPGHILGASILGTEESLAGLASADVRAFHETRYRAPRLVVSAVGAVDADRIQEMFANRLTLPEGEGVAPAVAPEVAERCLALHSRDVSQLYLTFFCAAPHTEARLRPAVQLLSDILGGGMSSRLFQSIRERSGLAYSVYSCSEHFDDTGMFSTVLAVSPSRGPEAVRRTLQELDGLLRDGLEEGELDSAKAQVRGSMIMGLESLTNRMSHLAETEVRRGRLEAYEEELAEYERVTEAEIMEAANLVLDPARMSLVALGPGDLGSLDDGSYARVISEEDA